MTIEHHPTEEMLTAFAAGTVDLGQHVAIATHLVSCPHCRTFMRDMESVGGALLSDLKPTDMAGDALQRVQARLGEPTPRSAPAAVPRITANEVPGLPDFVRHYRYGAWKWIAPSVHLRPVELPASSATRVFLLRSGPGTRMLQHTHTDLELTCVLSGSFRHEGGHYGPGSFDIGDADIDHQPIVDADESCVCLVAMQGDLRLKGLIGRMMQPFVRV